MSRFKEIGGLPFDKKASHKKATVAQLVALAVAEDVSLDDLLEEGLTQGQVRQRMTDIFHGDVVPQEVLERKRELRELARTQPRCRICSVLGTECEGFITRHHFVPRWLMLKLENYQAYATRRYCTIPICIGRHRDLHLDGDADTPKSIAQFMTDDERGFAQKMLDELFEQVGPSTREWLDTGGSGREYDYQLIQDYHNGHFRGESKFGKESVVQNSSQASG